MQEQINAPGFRLWFSTGFFRTGNASSAGVTSKIVMSALFPKAIVKARNVA